jgi:hypothetical protein
MMNKSIPKVNSRAERQAAPKPVRIPSGDRRMHAFDEGPT